ncbi:MAG: hypothetical protein QOG54_586 [Actinomycetota bacterium]|nr:hypothetical protein [Actinomycetota bacterium]
MTYQLREYTVKPGEMDEFIAEWRELVLPLRRKFGWEVVGPWISRDENRFVWIVGTEGDGETKDKEYYESPERAAIDPDPARHLSEVRKMWMENVRS